MAQKIKIHKTCLGIAIPKKFPSKKLFFFIARLLMKRFFCVRCMRTVSTKYVEKMNLIQWRKEYENRD